MTYRPQPVDTSGIRLSLDVKELTEELAHHAHEVWARQRIKDGWSWGSTRDDKSKQHPCLVAYEELDDSERQYDRNAALETLKVILAKGYRLVPPTRGQQAQPGSEAIAVSAAEDILDRLLAAQKERSAPELSVLLQVWNSRREDDLAWWCLPELYRHLGRRFLALGEAPLAREVTQTALQLAETDESRRSHLLWSHDVVLRQIRALALARSGNSDAAQQELLELRKEDGVDEETLGMLARTYKDQAFAPSVSDDQRRRLLKTSLLHYREAYLPSGGFWTGINVATLERLLDTSSQPTSTGETARQVQTQCHADLELERNKGTAPDKTYWHLATLGEAALNLGDIAEAGRYYREAYEVAPKNFGDLITTRRHARWLLDHWITDGLLNDSDSGLLDEWLPLPNVVVFSGHMIDRPNRPSTRFPAKMKDAVRATIREWLQTHSALIGYSSAACGADLLFQEAIQEFGGESRIVLPYDADSFAAESVDFAGPEWSKRYAKVMENAMQVVIASPQHMPSDGTVYGYANLILRGLASLRAEELKGDRRNLLGLVVWDGKSGDGPGGTDSVTRHWRDLGMNVDQIDVSPERPDAAGGLPVIVNPNPPMSISDGPTNENGDNKIKAMLFGDAVNYSKLTELQVSRFVEHFMRPISKILGQYAEANVAKNTWGDGLFLVFNHVREAGQCALDICQFIRSQIYHNQWERHQLPEDLNFRVALHAGPVMGFIDPITGQKNYTGSHVSRAARLEPKTPPGEVFASQSFAALCAEHDVTEFSCEYVKQLEWAKQYGSFPTYVLRRRGT